MRRWPFLAAALLLLAGACTTRPGSVGSVRSASPSSSTAESSATGARVWSGSSDTPVRVGLELHSTRVITGQSIAGRITVNNRTGQPIVFAGCGGLFQVLLTNPAHPASPAWPTCVQQLSVPVGVSSYPVTVAATFGQCRQVGASGAIPACTPSGMPGLPSGTYRATTYESSPVVPIPPAVTVVVLPS
jgi:hypothetical protein